MRTRSGIQEKLFDTGAAFPNGLVYRPGFITSAEEDGILDAIGAIPLEQARFGEYTSKRRIAAFGWGYDEEERRFIPGEPLPKFLEPLAKKIAKWLDIPRFRVVEALINEYEPGTQLGWHRDREAFEHIVGVSLGGWARMRFRPLPLSKKKDDILSLDLEARSAYIMQGDVRWRWQHSVAETRTHRWSITFRTLPPGIKISQAKPGK